MKALIYWIIHQEESQIFHREAKLLRDRSRSLPFVQKLRRTYHGTPRFFFHLRLVSRPLYDVLQETQV